MVHRRSLDAPWNQPMDFFKSQKALIIWQLEIIYLLNRFLRNINRIFVEINLIHNKK
ncbi:MAG: hypothetical protein K0Q95_1194 [Bacteroidota bacterium]|jgi:hypothetical protein|nr:hypothetical protein [Bacteroidota bacterium]